MVTLLILLILLINVDYAIQKKIKVKLPNVNKIILTKGPYKRYKAYIWYSPDELKENT